MCNDEGRQLGNRKGLMGSARGGDQGSIGFSSISEDNDDFTKKRHRFEDNYDILEGSSSSNAVYQQVKQMEASDDQLSQKRKNFDSDYERMQQERGELMRGQGAMGPGGPGPGGPGPGGPGGMGGQGGPGGQPMMRR